ncbi:DUF5798 family protein [Haloarcula sp. S1CR25-12]|uniref:DUF5798 family protein n=1 Tax=Haloarcula saliterrae TaxID=2950534 RepID=A0ABU2FAQ4_9EURY|nr:DUF5798 family protein [Haloarcula sp. S1CR25-12]MDS0259282.1 DUF5798 family protein [Haloarcula sp. S1CR25-12]
MGLGSTAKKLQKVADIADELYAKVNEQREQLQELRGAVEETNTRVTEMDRELGQQRALLEAIAEEQGLDADEILTEAVIEDAEAASPDRAEPDQSVAESTD